jgi:hypothetical protein
MYIYMMLTFEAGVVNFGSSRAFPTSSVNQHRSIRSTGETHTFT